MGNNEEHSDNRQLRYQRCPMREDRDGRAKVDFRGDVGTADGLYVQLTSIDGRDLVAERAVILGKNTRATAAELHLHL